MYSIVDTQWQVIHRQLKLYGYVSGTRRLVKSSQPILMLHGTLAAHQSWNEMAEYLWTNGFESLYALDMEGLQANGPFGDVQRQVEQTIQYLLDDLHPRAETVTVIGHAAGGSVAYRYWQPLGDKARIGYLFMIAAPQQQTIFTVLKDYQMDPSTNKKNVAARATQTISMSFNRITSVQPTSSTTVVNMMGNLPGHDLFDGVVRGIRLPEATNEIFYRDTRHLHRILPKDPEVFKTILSYLKGERYLVRLKLVGLRMLREDKKGYSGPVVFEIDGNLMPPDIFFEAITERLYLFEDRIPPMCTVSYPIENVSATITIHLKDLSDIQGRRRRMYTRLHIPLSDNESSAHAMQDSEGSDFLWRIVCKSVPSMIGDVKAPNFHDDLARGL